MVAHKKGASAGIFWMNPSETWIDIVKTKSDGSQGAVQKVFSFNKKAAETSTQTHWISEAGILDVFVFFGPTSKDVLRQYTKLTGTLAMPQMFSLGYHQCRWNYINTRDVLEVDSKFDEYDMPYDVIWLDIEYTDEKKYFTWDKPKFADPIKMEEVLDSKGRKVSLAWHCLYLIALPLFSFSSLLLLSILTLNVLKTTTSVTRANPRISSSKRQTRPIMKLGAGLVSPLGLILSKTKPIIGGRNSLNSTSLRAQGRMFTSGTT
jgi:hypothetical protein